MGTTYRQNGALATQTLPAVGGLPGGTNGEKLTYQYHSTTGLPKALSTNAAQGVYLYDTTYFYDGLVYNQYLGTSGQRVRVQHNYTAPGRRLSSMYVNTETPATPGDYGTSKLANDNYTYDNAGNITYIRSTLNGVVDQQECLRYDHLRRLTEAWTQLSGACTTPQRGGADPYWRQWSFDTLGNRLTQVDKNPTGGDTTWTSTVGTAAGVKPHQVNTITSTGPLADTTTRTFGYDPGGNTTTRTTPTGTTQTLTWDKEGHLATLTEGSQTTTYLYDTEGNRLIATSSDKKTLYLPDGTELEVPTSGATLGTRHYNGIAVRDTAGLHWTVTDHHGTPMAQIDPATLAIGRRRSMPYGEARGTQATNWKGTKGYVGGTRDDTGLTHLGAREYDPTLGRFVSVDPVMDLADPTQWNAYSYASNSPVTASDPTGLKPQFDDLADQHAWQKAGGNQFTRKKRLKGYFKRHIEATLDDTGLGGIPELAGMNSFINGLDDMTLGGLIRTGQLIANETALGVDRWSKVLDGEWTVGQAMNDYIENSLPNQPMPWDNAVAVIDLAAMAVQGGIAVAQGDTTTAASSAGYLTGVGTGILLTERALRFGRGCRHSFAPTTLVLLANRTTKPINDVAVGDLVLATDPDTGQTTPQPVTQLHLNDDRDLAEVDLIDEQTGHTTTLETTWHHPFWNATDNHWTDAADLTPGTHLRDTQGKHTQKVVAVRTWTGLRQMRDLTIANIHTYYVMTGNTPVLVHNDNGGWTPSAATKVMRGGPFGATYYQMPADRMGNVYWWSRDMAGHGDSQWKIFTETKTGLEWYADADKNGTYIEGKHKGSTGMKVPFKNLKTVNVTPGSVC